VLIVHRDVRGKAFSLLVILALGFGALQVAQYVPASRAEARGNVVDALGERGRTVTPAVNQTKNAVKVLGLDYMVPASKKSAPARSSALEMMRESGLLRGYSVPSRRLAFTQDGGSIILPPSPEVKGPREVSVIYHGNRNKKRIALTFDSSDVGEPDTARAILDELTRLRAPATFFVCGAWCYRNPDILRAAVDRGFEVASHSFSHPVFSSISNEQMVSEIRRTEEAVRKVTGTGIAAYFRPPYGEADARVKQVVAQLGYATAMWSIDTNDWRASTIRENIRDRATVDARGGDVILMHTLGRYTDDALVEIVTNLRAEGFELTTLTGVMQPE
jgi:peptidoglycan/xylan/chitin deacetylase (PgdA/CDA1 family)